MDNILHNILKNPNTNDLDVLHLFLNISTNLADKEKIARLIENKISLQNNQSIPNFTLFAKRILFHHLLESIPLQ